MAPEIWYATRSLPQSGGGHSIPGTVYCGGVTFIRYVEDILTSYAAGGARMIVVINGHYENEALIFEAAELCRDCERFTNTALVALSWWNVVDHQFIIGLLPHGFRGWHAEHAAICETSLMLHLRPDTVREVRVDNLHPPLAGVYLHPAEEVGAQGVLSETTGSSREIGRALFLHVCDRIEALIWQQISRIGVL